MMDVLTFYILQNRCIGESEIKKKGEDFFFRDAIYVNDFWKNSAIFNSFLIKFDRLCGLVK